MITGPAFSGAEAAPAIKCKLELGSRALLHRRMRPDCAILVCSCDAYSDLWAPFFALFQRYWGDCPFPVYLGAERRSASILGVTTLHSDGGKDWSRCAMDYLSAIEQPNVLLLLDDFFLRSPVDTQRVLETLSFHQRHAAIQTRLVPRPPPTDTIPGERLIGKCAPGSPYRLSTQAAFWNKAYLMRLLNPGEAIWAFEKLGNERALEFQEGFYAARSQVIPYVGIFTHHVVEKGAWFIHEKWIFSRKNIGCDFSKRRTLPLWQTAIYQLAQITNIGLLILPWRWRVVISAMLKATARQLLGKGVERLGAPPT